MDCLFCKIAQGSIPSAKVYEDDSLVAFLDIKPVNPGHVLIIPKQHYPSLLETPEAVAGSLLAIAPSLGKALMQATKAEGFNVAVNTGRVAGQVVDHVHVHLMPRHAGDGYELWHGKPYENQEAMHKMGNSIRSALQ